MPSLKFLTALPIPFASPGRRFAPKIRITISRMMRSSGSPSDPNMLMLQRVVSRETAWIVPLIGAALLAVAAGESAAYGQFTSGVSLVEVYASVADRAGRPVTGLTAADFEVREDGVVQRVAAFGAGDVPLSIVIALDRSFSMGGQRLALAKRAAASFIGALRPDDEVSVMAVGSEIETITPPMPAAAAAATRWEA